MDLAESILRKLVAGGHVGATEGGAELDYWPHDGDGDEHKLNEAERAYLRQLDEEV